MRLQRSVVDEQVRDRVIPGQDVEPRVANIGRNGIDGANEHTQAVAALPTCFGWKSLTRGQGEKMGGFDPIEFENPGDPPQRVG
ncbi:hypothetical protein Tasa_029_025 [Tanticharoenia sakaeratensis NBRC 103193]|uniref:Uncharacterized protein n=1 Tax=Tanticharoenia sakaeratensis NBRC 103193 TaxID=1231623 RepID=A0A0D6MM66_9PROT|nr:hypothetical protein Tasa_029_025 [Tanticharoenia sakaeratensis NBRC 103193]GBQ23177.1 hypothetical protein AA103193_2319 [Tanticharoenia sakaeratensis NBRC 103193]